MNCYVLSLFYSDAAEGRYVESPNVFPIAVYLSLEEAGKAKKCAETLLNAKSGEGAGVHSGKPAVWVTTIRLLSTDVYLC